jgi:hypothetical protein
MTHNALTWFVGIPFRWEGEWSSRARARVWACVATESTAYESAQLPTEVKDVLAMCALVKDKKRGEIYFSTSMSHNFPFATQK